ncbi:MAG: EamA family transporter RarD, partial [Thermoanaerobaculia bacterium]
MTSTSETRAGIAFGIAAYASWGFIAVYFKLVGAVPPLEILAHRIVWSVAILLLIITVSRRWPDFAKVVAEPRRLLPLVVSTVLIAVNWFIFIWAVTTSHMVEASLGYYINPLVNVLLGFLFLGERLRKLEWTAVALAGAAVTWLAITVGVIPWVSLALAVSFGVYGLVRKKAGVPSIEGLTIETLILLPLAAGYLAYLGNAGTLAFGSGSTKLDLLLIAAGPVTALPLLWFASAVRRLRLATVGLLQYIAPTIQFTLAVTVYGEPFGHERAVAFALIWT